MVVDDHSSFSPTVAVCLLTTDCNFRCVYCYASGGEKPLQELPLELGQRAIDTACQNALDAGEEYFSVSFHGGGEPTLARENFRLLVDYARSKELPCEISVASNGYWSRNLTDWILNHIDNVSLSFDGPPALQNRQRPLVSGKGSFPVVMRTIREMDQRSFPYGIRMTVTDDGIDDLVPAVEYLCNETECRVFQVEPAFDHGRAHSRQLALGRTERFATEFMKAYDLAFDSGRHLYYSGARPWALTNRFCQAIDRALIVAPDGGLTACYEVYGQEHPLAPSFFFGRLSATDMTLEPGVRERLQGQIAERRGLCEGCFCYWHCAGDCPPKTLSTDHSGHLNFGPRCDLNRTITKALLLRYLVIGGGIWHGERDSQARQQEALS